MIFLHHIESRILIYILKAIYIYMRHLSHALSCCHEVQLQRAAKLCGDRVDFIYLEGRMRSERRNVMWEEMAQSFPNEPFYDWARWVQELPVERRRYHDLEETLDYLQELLREHETWLLRGFHSRFGAETAAEEPVHGIFGFSQGANMASLLAAEAVQGTGGDTRRRPRTACFRCDIG